MPTLDDVREHIAQELAGFAHHGILTDYQLGFAGALLVLAGQVLHEDLKAEPYLSAHTAYLQYEGFKPKTEETVQ
jgi:hypothetical protein